ncbi:hypothetical protein CYMTET_27500, partial [Cymbomonas tetramitiformis]
GSAWISRAGSNLHAQGRCVDQPCWLEASRKSGCVDQPRVGSRSYAQGAVVDQPCWLSFTQGRRAVVVRMQARGGPSVGHLDDFMGGHSEAQENAALQAHLVSFLRFTVSGAKCQGPSQQPEFLGVLLSTEGEVCPVAIDEDRVAHVLVQAMELQAKAPKGMMCWKVLESLPGLPAAHCAWCRPGAGAWRARRGRWGTHAGELAY